MWFNSEHRRKDSHLPLVWPSRRDQLGVTPMVGVQVDHSPPGSLPLPAETPTKYTTPLSRSVRMCELLVSARIEGVTTLAFVRPVGINPVHSGVVAGGPTQLHCAGCGASRGGQAARRGQRSRHVAFWVRRRVHDLHGPRGVASGCAASTDPIVPVFARDRLTVVGEGRPLPGIVVTAPPDGADGLPSTGADLATDLVAGDVFATLGLVPQEQNAALR